MTDQSDQERVERLKSYYLLDSRPEEIFDRITRLAAQIFEVPTAVISLVDTDRQWFKSRHGLEAEQTPRDIAFCDRAIRQDDIYEVIDPVNDPEFKDNPLVTGDLGLRYYAGVPLRTKDGFALGTLCLIDYENRPALDDRLRDILVDLGKVTMQQIELRRANLNSLALVEKTARASGAFSNDGSVTMGRFPRPADS